MQGKSFRLHLFIWSVGGSPTSTQPENLYFPKTTPSKRNLFSTTKDYHAKRHSTQSRTRT
ncbi:hypothetical protein QDY71_04990 [Kingella negevensis]|uniref:hypothetical protein n=1 Tax=Kingella negevensis TaxID=1522312 RepID=UPI00117B950E|nr:hypothetical protein [Kingella negevensis]MDK4697119.1 hypothetical protein [Kingella negevensis]